MGEFEDRFFNCEHESTELLTECPLCKIKQLTAENQRLIDVIANAAYDLKESLG